MNGVEITEDQVRAARRAYYGAISYVDDHISRLIGVLRDTGRLDRTVVIVTSDHGEMLGERGAWYKMSFFEGAARVPLIVSAPALFPPGRVAAAVSTMDLLPTLAGLAHDGDPPGIVGPLDGRSLLPHLSGAPDRDEVVAEYLAEGAIAPIVMIRRGRTSSSTHRPTRTSSTIWRPTRTSGSTWPAIRRRPRWPRGSGGRSPRGGTWRRWTTRSARASGGGSPSARRSARARRPRGTSPRRTTPHAATSATTPTSPISRRWPASRRSGASWTARRRDRSRPFRRRA